MQDTQINEIKVQHTNKKVQHTNKKKTSTHKKIQNYARVCDVVIGINEAKFQIKNENCQIESGIPMED